MKSTRSSAPGPAAKDGVLEDAMRPVRRLRTVLLVVGAQGVATLVYVVAVLAKKPQYTMHPSAHSTAIAAIVVLGLLPAVAAGVVAGLSEWAYGDLRKIAHVMVVTYAICLAALAFELTYGYPTGPKGAEIGPLVVLGILSCIEITVAGAVEWRSRGLRPRSIRDQITFTVCGVIIALFAVVVFLPEIAD